MTIRGRPVPCCPLHLKCLEHRYILLISFRFSVCIYFWESMRLTCWLVCIYHMCVGGAHARGSLVLLLVGYLPWSLSFFIWRHSLSLSPETTHSRWSNQPFSPGEPVTCLSRTGITASHCMSPDWLVLFISPQNETWRPHEVFGHLIGNWNPLRDPSPCSFHKSPPLP